MTALLLLLILAALGWRPTWFLSQAVTKRDWAYVDQAAAYWRELYKLVTGKE